MGMGFTFITSPEKLEPPPPATYACLENSLVSGSEVRVTKSSSVLPNLKAVVVAVAMLGGALSFF